MGRVILTVATAVVLASVIAGIVIVGSPREGRLAQLDDTRRADLQGLMAEVDRFQEREGRLPQDLAELAADPRSTPTIVDPGSGILYEYRVVGPTAYELCAVFDRPSPDPDPRTGPDFWAHGAGRSCFPLEVRR